MLLYIVLQMANNRLIIGRGVNIKNGRGINESTYLVNTVNENNIMFPNLTKFLIILITYISLLSGCATPYMKQGFVGGFSETQLGENIFRVTFKGNKYTSKERATDFTLLRSAELCLEKNFRYFVIAETEKYEKTSLHSRPIIVGDYSYGTFTSVNTRPRTSNTIIAFREKPEVNAIIYDAEFIRKSIKAKYEIKD